MPALGTRDVELHISAPLCQPHLQRPDQGCCGAGRNHSDNQLCGGAHRPGRTGLLTLTEMSAQLGFIAKPVLQGLNVRVPAIHRDT